MPSSTASQFIEYKKRRALQSGDTQQTDKKSISKFSSFSPPVSSIALPLTKFLANPTYKPPVAIDNGGGGDPCNLIENDNGEWVDPCTNFIYETNERVILIDYNGDVTSLESIVIPDTVTSIGDSAFAGCTSLTSLTLGVGLETIGSNAFVECNNLESLVIPDTVTSIGDSAFAGCTSLTTLDLGGSITTIEAYAFFLCNLSLNLINAPDGVTATSLRQGTSYTAPPPLNP